MTDEEIEKAYKELRARQDAEQKAQDLKEREAAHKKFVEMVKPFLNQPPVVIVGEVYENVDESRSVGELEEFLDTLPYMDCLPYVPGAAFSEKCIVRITVEVIGPRA